MAKQFRESTRAMKSKHCFHLCCVVAVFCATSPAAPKTQVLCNLPDQTTRVVMTSATEVWATSATELWRSTDAGKNWSLLKVPNVPQRVPHSPRLIGAIRSGGLWLIDGDIVYWTL